MDDAGGVGLGEAFGQLYGDVEGGLRREALLTEDIPEGPALHTLGDDVGQALGPPDLVDGEDVRVVREEALRASWVKRASRSVLEV